VLNVSKYVVYVKGTVLQFAASVSKRKLIAHFIALAAMMVRSAQIVAHLQLHQVLSKLVLSDRSVPHPQPN